MAEFPIKKEIVYTFWAVKNSTGVYPFGKTGTISAGALSMMAQARGIQTFALAQSPPAQKTLLADGKPFHSYRPQPTEPVTAEVGAIVLDQDLRLNSLGLTAHTEGQHSVILMTNSCLDYAKLCLVQVYRADIYDDSTGVVTTGKWWIEEYLDVDVFSQLAGGSGDPTADPEPWTYDILFREPSTTLHGETLTTADYGAAKGFGRMYSSDYPVIYGAIVGDNSTTAYTIPSGFDPVGNAATYIQMWDDGIEQAYGTSAGEFELDSSNNQQINFATAPETDSIHIFKLEFNGSGC
ncbi:MAG: hypothetical protein ACPG7F_00910 [Aggregatilineales bacterium]